MALYTETAYQDIIDRKVGINPATAVAYSKADFPASFPFARWVMQQRKYEEYWHWFTGQIWEETIQGAQDKSGDPVYRFPLKVNMIKTAAMKHSAVVMGEAPDGPDPLVSMRVTPRQMANDAETPADNDKEMARELETFINEVWMENNGRVIQAEGALLQQFLGGIVYKLTWSPLDDNLLNKIRIEMILPDFFMPVWDSGNPEDLLEAFLVWRIPAREAFLKYGYTSTGTTTAGPQPDYVIYIEHWTKKTITITLGGQALNYQVERVNGQGELIEMVNITYNEEPNPFGFVPMVYIPKERAGGYYGLSLIDDVRGLAKEINARMADIGDSLAETSHREVYVKNIAGQIRTRDIGGTRSVTDLGQQIPNTGEPDAFAIDPPKLSDGLVGFPEMLREQFLRDAFLSSVAEGEDEGSQRSALTLAFRMWPLTSKAHITRAYWEVGLVRLGKMIAKIAIFHKVSGITEDHMADMTFHCNWNPMVPRDREQMVNEVSLLLSANALSPQTALTLLSVVPDAAEEMDKIREWMEYQSKMQMEQEKAKMKMKTEIQTPVASTGLNNR